VQDVHSIGGPRNGRPNTTPLQVAMLPADHQQRHRHQHRVKLLPNRKGGDVPRRPWLAVVPKVAAQHVQHQRAAGSRHQHRGAAARVPEARREARERVGAAREQSGCKGGGVLRQVGRLELQPLDPPHEDGEAGVEGQAHDEGERGDGAAEGEGDGEEAEGGVVIVVTGRRRRLVALLLLLASVVIGRLGGCRDDGAAGLTSRVWSHRGGAPAAPAAAEAAARHPRAAVDQVEDVQTHQKPPRAVPEAAVLRGKVVHKAVAGRRQRCGGRRAVARDLKRQGLQQELVDSQRQHQAQRAVGQEAPGAL